MSIFETLYRGVYTKFFPDYLCELHRALADVESVLDVGCGKDSLLKHFPRERLYREGVEAFAPYLEESRAKGIHHKYHAIDALELERHFAPKSFDVVYMGDVIEHFDKADGLRMIEMMSRIARKKVILYTPNGFMPLPARDGNDLYAHRSGWEVEEMRSLGFEVIGSAGWKALRGDDAGIRLWPKPFWRVVSDLTQYYTRSHPELAKQIFCVKQVG